MQSRSPLQYFMQSVRCVQFELALTSLASCKAQKSERLPSSPSPQATQSSDPEWLRMTNLTLLETESHLHSSLIALILSGGVLMLNWKCIHFHVIFYSIEGNWKVINLQPLWCLAPNLWISYPTSDYLIYLWLLSLHHSALFPLWAPPPLLWAINRLFGPVVLSGSWRGGGQGGGCCTRHSSQGSPPHRRTVQVILLSSTWQTVPISSVSELALLFILFLVFVFVSLRQQIKQLPNF